MTIYHLHHIIPRHMGGSDDPSNLIKLTVDEHAEAHKKLWEEHGNEYDRIAWRCLAGIIDGEQARIEAVKVAVTGVPKSEEHRKKISEARKKDWATNDELRKKLSIMNKGNTRGTANKGRIFSCHSLEKMSAAKKGKPQRRCCCIVCKKEISVSNTSNHYKIHIKKEGP